MKGSISSSSASASSAGSITLCWCAFEANSQSAVIAAASEECLLEERERVLVESWEGEGRAVFGATERLREERPGG